VSRFEEALTVITDLVRTGRADLDGTYVTARDVVLRPAARPDLPILVASKGPRMMDLTARHADAWNAAWFGEPDERLAGRRADLAAACARVGRDPATLTITVGIEVRYPDAEGAQPPDPDDHSPFLSGTPEVIAAGLRMHADAGADHVIATLTPCTPETVAAFAEAVALFRASPGVRA
jgi:alkanesulfonate monooxygenase SsuD/methylene tetrahydromethanopterin reductase-like flavin-dependent oxidoreductase (luciferase family)